MTTPHKIERTYTVSWHGPDGESHTCTNLTARVAFARLWNAYRNRGEITVTEVTPEGVEWVVEEAAKTNWPYNIPPPDCEDAKQPGWTCIVYDQTKLFCDTCTAWYNENSPELEARP